MTIHSSGWNLTSTQRHGNRTLSTAFSTGVSSQISQSEAEGSFGGGGREKTHSRSIGPGKTPESIPGGSPPNQITQTSQGAPEQLSTSFPTLLGSPAPEPSTPKPVDKTSVAVLTQVTEDASTTVRQTRGISPPQTPTQHAQPGGETPQSMKQSSDAGAAAGGGIASLFSDTPVASSTPEAGQSGDGNGDQGSQGGDTVPDNSTPEIVTPLSSPIGDGQNGDGQDGSGSGSPQHGTTSSGNDGSGSDSSSSGGSGSSNSDSDGNGGSGSSGSSGRQGSGSQSDGSSNSDPEGSSSGDGNSPGSGSQSGSGSNSGAGDEGLQSAIQSLIQNPPQSAGSDDSPRQSVTIGNTPLAVQTLPTGSANSGDTSETVSSGSSEQQSSGDSKDGSNNKSPSAEADGSPNGESSGSSNGGGVVVGEQTIQPGETGTVNGVPVSVPSSGSALIVGGSSTIDVERPTETANIGNGPVNLQPAPSSGSGSSGGVIIAGQTIQPGHTGTVNGVSVSVPTSGSALVIGGTSTLNVQSPAQTENIGGQPVTVQPAPSPAATPDGGIVLGGQTIRPGQVATIHNTPVSLAAQGSSLVIGGTRTVQIQNPTQPPTLELGGSTITANPTGAFVIGSQTLVPGSSAIVISGSTVSLAPSGSVVVINGKTSTLQGSSPAPTAAPILTVNGQTFTASVSGSSTQFILGSGTTLTPGGSLVVSGTTISLPSAGANNGGNSNIIVINGHTSTLGSAPVFPAVTTAPVLTLPNGQEVTAHVSGTKTSFVINNSETLTPGGVVTISSDNAGSKTTISFPTTGSGAGGVVVVNGHTSTLDAAFVTPAPVLTLNNHPVTATADSDGDAEFVFNDGAGHTQTLTRGGTVTVSGSTIAFPSTGVGSIVVINGHTSTLGHASEGGALITAAPVLTIGGQTYSPSITGSSTYYVIGGKTLTPGGIITVSGTRISLAEHESVLVVGSKTTTLAGPATVQATTTSDRNGITTSASNRPSSSTGSPQVTSKNDSGVGRLAVGLWMTLTSILVTTFAVLL